jgi:CRP/FNR family cyclic AMP-dependent transcriptional regulator
MSTIQQHEMPVFTPPTFPSSAVVKRNVVEYKKGARIFTQGDASKHVLYIQQGGVKLSVVNKGGKEAVIAILGPGDFFGEGCMSGLPFRMSTATAIMGTKLLVIEKSEMIRALHAKHAFSDRFISYMLSRNIRVEEDLTDQLFNSTEKRLARTLLLLASYGKQGQPQKMLPKISQETLAGMVGTTRSRVNVFMNKFKKLGFIDYKNTIRINNSLLNFLLNDCPPTLTV